MKDLNISVVIPNYNGAHLFPETLPALYQALNNTERQYEIIISDDCSTDDSGTFIRTNYPDIVFISSDQNTGFSKTINRGIALAKHELTLLLNSDVKLRHDYFKPLFAHFDKRDTFGVMGKIIGWNDDEIQDAGKWPTTEGFKLKTSVNYLFTSSDEAMPSMYLSGANALVQTHHLRALGGFPEIYSPFYMEDVDLSIRAWRIGLSCFCEPRAICRHRTSTSIKAKSTKSQIRRIYNRNKLYFHAIHLSRWRLAGWLCQTLLELIFRTLTLRFDYLLSFGDSIRNIQYIVRIRKEFHTSNNVVLGLNEVICKIRSLAGQADKLIFKR